MAAMTMDEWVAECAGGSTQELLHLNMLYVAGNPFGLTDEIIGVLRAEIRRRVPASMPSAD